MTSEEFGKASEGAAAPPTYLSQKKRKKKSGGRAKSNGSDTEKTGF